MSVRTSRSKYRVIVHGGEAPAGNLSSRPPGKHTETVPGMGATTDGSTTHSGLHRQIRNARSGKRSGNHAAFHAMEPEAEPRAGAQEGRIASQTTERVRSMVRNSVVENCYARGFDFARFAIEIRSAKLETAEDSIALIYRIEKGLPACPRRISFT